MAKDKRFRPNWSQLTKNINELNLKSVDVENINLKHIYGGLNERYLPDRYNVLFKREYKKVGDHEVGYNVMKTSKGMNATEKKELNLQRQQFMADIGYGHFTNEAQTRFVYDIDLSSAKSFAMELSKVTYETRSAEVGSEIGERYKAPKFGEIYEKGARNWTNHEWKIANELMKSGMNSKDAIEFTFAIVNDDRKLFEALYKRIDRRKWSMEKFEQTGLIKSEWMKNIFSETKRIIEREAHFNKEIVGADALQIEDALGKELSIYDIL